MVEDATTCIPQLLLSMKTNGATFMALCSLFNFICRTVRPGRAFIRRLYDAMSNLPKHYHISVTNEIKKDLNMWLLILNDYTLMAPLTSATMKTNAELQLFTNSSANPELGWEA